MNVYQLKDIPEKYKSLQLDVLNLATQLGNRKLAKFMFTQPVTNESWEPIWKGCVVGEFKKASPKSTDIPDISWWYHDKLVLNEKAYLSLKEHMESEGEFLPFTTTDGQAMYVFNCLSFAKIDSEKSEKKYTDEGYEHGLKTLVFDNDDIKSRLVFKSKEEGCNRLYASGQFKELCEGFGLNGLRFEDDLLEIF